MRGTYIPGRSSCVARRRARFIYPVILASPKKWALSSCFEASYSWTCSFIRVGKRLSDEGRRAEQEIVVRLSTYFRFREGNPSGVKLVIVWPVSRTSKICFGCQSSRARAGYQQETHIDEVPMKCRKPSHVETKHEYSSPCFRSPYLAQHIVSGGARLCGFWVQNLWRFGVRTGWRLNISPFTGSAYVLRSRKKRTPDKTDKIQLQLIRTKCGDSL